MASKTAVLAIKIIGEAADAVKALNQTETAVKNTEKSTKKSGLAMASVWTTVAAAMAACVRQAMLLESATVAVETIFEDQSAQMIEWAEGMAQYGLSTAEAAQASAVLGAQLKATGIEGEAAVVIVQELVETSALLAQVMGGSTTDAVMAMGAALRGEYDSLERFGIAITGTAVQTKMAELAAEGYTFATEQQAKMVATLALIQEQANAILGDTEEQTLTLRTATDHLWASIKNLAGALADGLAPALAPIIEMLADTIDRTIDLAAESEILQAVMEVLTTILEGLAEILDPVIITALELCQTVMDSLARFIETYVMPILDRLVEALDRVADALDKLIGWINDAIEAFDRFIGKIGEAWDALTFWNNNAEVEDPAAASSAMFSSPVPSIMGMNTTATRTRGVSAAAVVNINVTGAADPYALAKLIARSLKDYANVQGRDNYELAGAW